MKLSNNRLAILVALVAIWCIHGIINRGEGYTPLWSGSHRLLYSPRDDEDDVGARRVKSPLMWMS